MSRQTDYTSNCQQRILKVMQALAGHEFAGMAPKELATAVGTTQQNITRDLDNLKTAGVAEPLDTGRWRLTPKVIQMAVAFQLHLDRAQSRVNEINNRYTRNPH